LNFTQSKNYRLETSKSINIYSNGINTVVFDEYSMSTAAVTDKTAKILEILKIPRSFKVFSTLWMKAYPETNIRDLETILDSLISEGYLLHNGELPNTKKINKRHSEGKVQPPKMMGVYITKKCNLECKYCYNKENRQYKIEPDLTYKEWEQILNSAHEYGVREFHITGGEPLLRRDLFPIYRELVNKGAVFYLNTNAILINSSQDAMVIKEIFRGISISIDSYAIEEHEQMRGVGSYNRAINGAKLLTKANALWHAQMVCGLHNIASIEQTERFVKEIGGERLNASIVFDPKMSQEEYARIVNVLDMTSATVSNSIFPQYSEEERRHKDTTTRISVDTPCAAARTECCVDSSGNLYPCRLMVVEEMLCGNLLEKDFNYIWEHSDVLKNFRNFDYEKVHLCSECSFFRLCKGGCRAMALLATGDIYAYPGDAQCANKKRAIFDKLSRVCAEQRMRLSDAYGK